ncbi:MAG: hypothetical protein ABF332_00385 [Akkermansiaceae bacterium]
MKPLWSIIKIVLLAALLIGAFFGYRFFKVWQENERPTVTSTEWENAETTLGGSATLLVTLDVPWHREFSTANPTSHPDGFLPVRHETALQKGQLNLNGTREWKLRIPLVATAAALPEGQTLSIPLKSTERLSPGSVNIPLPALSITALAEIPRDPLNPKDFLQPDTPVISSGQKSAFEEKEPFPWWIIILAVILIIAVTIFAMKKAAHISATPPWERAMGKLDNLDISQNPTSVVASLTDILKDYTSERYNLSANTKTSSEFLAIVKTIPDLTKEEITELPWLARVADAAKFAGRTPTEDAPPRALSVVREFVENTTPQETDSETDA